jgi:hypothetical protein
MNGNCNLKPKRNKHNSDLKIDDEFHLLLQI